MTDPWHVESWCGLHIPLVPISTCEHLFFVRLSLLAGLTSGSGKPKTEKVGNVTKAQVEVRIAEPHLLEAQPHGFHSTV